MALNLRSNQLTYHPMINSIIFWHKRVPKRLTQMLNRVGITGSYPSQAKVIAKLSQDSVRRARAAAHDVQKLKNFGYDNFNWMGRAWEASALHGSVQHDEVSAILWTLPLPDGPDAPSTAHLASVERFLASSGTRHRIPAEIALRAIIPSANDQNIFRKAAILHVAYILTDEIQACAKFRYLLHPFEDPSAKPARKTERYFLPTFDQEQASTRGNMVVLRHYFQKILQLPAEVFERLMFFIVGDRLTTARDRAAQDQRAVDRSDDRVDHLSSFAMTSGLMHICLNFIQNVARNYWGQEEKEDIGLAMLRSSLPNRNEVNPKKIDFYAWLRFLDAVLRSLVITAVTVNLKLQDPADIDTADMDLSTFMGICTGAVDSYLMPSVSRLEADQVKTTPGPTVSSHAVLLMHDLMTLREMRHAIKHGHPQRILRMLKYWMPMFYAGGGYNYANELMELLHNIQHDWPHDSAQVLLGGMIVCPSGRPDGHVEADLDVEHLNGDIKSHAHGSNATPKLLEKITPAIGEAHVLTTNVFRELGVDDLNQHHAKVKQHKDIQLLVQHLRLAHTFDFAKDKVSHQTVVDLYRNGLHRLGGPDGGHAKHLARHQSRMRARHGNIGDNFGKGIFFGVDEGDEHERTTSRDETRVEFILRDEDDLDDLQEMLDMEENDDTIGGD